MEFLSALGACPKCRQFKISVNGEARCINCDSNSNTGSGMVVTVEDPGEEALNGILTKTGIKTEANKAIIAPKVEAKQTFQGASVDDALRILKSLPMPKDLKQFKQINKAIKILESLGE